MTVTIKFKGREYDVRAQMKIIERRIPKGKQVALMVCDKEKDYNEVMMIPIATMLEMATKNLNIIVIKDAIIKTPEEFVESFKKE